MKIKFLNDFYSEAFVTKGFWKWKKTAHVIWKKTHVPTPDDWDYVSGVRCPLELERALDNARKRERLRQQRIAERGNWLPIGQARPEGIPVAKVVSKK